MVRSLILFSSNDSILRCNLLRLLSIKSQDKFAIKDNSISSYIAFFCIKINIFNMKFCLLYQHSKTYLPVVMCPRY